MKKIKFFYLFLFFFCVISGFSQEISLVETVKKRDRAEMNIEITKIISKPLSAKHYPNEKKIIFQIDENGEEIFLAENLENLPSYSVTKRVDGLNRVIQQNRDLRAGKSVKNNSFSYKKITPLRNSNSSEKSSLELIYESLPNSLYLGVLNIATGDVSKVYNVLLEEVPTTYAVLDRSVFIPRASLNSWITIQSTSKDQGSINSGNTPYIHVQNGQTSTTGITSLIPAHTVLYPTGELINPGTGKAYSQSFEFRYSGGNLQIKPLANTTQTPQIYGANYTFIISHFEANNGNGKRTDFQILVYLDITPEFSKQILPASLIFIDKGESLNSNSIAQKIGNLKFQELYEINSEIATLGKKENFFPAIALLSSGFFGNSYSSFFNTDIDLDGKFSFSNAGKTFTSDLYFQNSSTINGELLVGKDSSGLIKLVGAVGGIVSPTERTGAIETLNSELWMKFDNLSGAIKLLREQPSQSLVLTSDNYYAFFSSVDNNAGTQRNSDGSSVGNSNDRRYETPSTLFDELSPTTPAFDALPLPNIVLTKDQKQNSVDFKLDPHYSSGQVVSFTSVGKIQAGGTGVSVNSGESIFLTGLPYENYVFTSVNGVTNPSATHFNSDGSGELVVMLDNSGTEPTTLHLMYESTGILKSFSVSNYENTLGNSYTLLIEHKDGNMNSFYSRRVYTLNLNFTTLHQSFSYQTSNLEFGKVLKGSGVSAKAETFLKIKDNSELKIIPSFATGNKVVLTKGTNSLTADLEISEPISDSETNEYSRKYIIKGNIPSEELSKTALSEGIYTGIIYLNIDIE